MAASNRISQVVSVFKAGLFSNKVAIVTGGATGIGKAITKELLHLGCKVVIASRNVDHLKQATEEMKQLKTSEGQSADISYQECNIRKEDQIKHLMQETLNRHGKIDLLVNNGGGQFPCPAASISLKGWNAVIETNLTGTFLMCREVFNHWMKDHGGCIVNIIADIYRGMPLMMHTGAARAGVDNLTKSLAIEWAENGVRVNAVAPGSSIYSETASSNYAGEKIFESRIPFIPGKRLGTPEEISAAVCFLLSPAASFITGETLWVDCGGRLYSSLLWNIPDHNNLPAYTDDDSHKSKL